MKPQATFPQAARLFIAFFVVLFLFNSFFLNQVFAATGINRTINFQGKLVNKVDGTNITDSTYSFTFKLYDAASGGTQLPSGTPWTETQGSVTVTNGVFRVALGSVTPIPSTLDFNDDSLYLDIAFNGETFSSRVRLAAVPFAFNAEKVSGLTVTNTTGTLTIPNAKTISFADSFTTSGTNPLTLITVGTTSVTLPTTGTLATLAGNEILTNKTIGSTGLIFSGAATDIDTAAAEGLVLQGRAASTFQTTSGAITLQPAGSSTISSVQIGAGGVGSTAPDYLGLDVKSDTGDPAGGYEGAMYYNTFDNKFRCYQGAAWADCVYSGGTTITFTGDSGSSATTLGTTRTIAGGTNGIDTSDNTAGTLTINFDSTEVGTTTFGSGSDFIWTFNGVGGTDPAITFGANSTIFTSGTASFSNRLGIGTTAPTVALDVVGAGLFSTNLNVNGNTTLGDATSDTVTLTGKITGATGAGLGFSDGSFTTCTALETVAGMLTCGTDDVGGGAGVWTDGTATAYLAVSSDWVGIGTSSPTDKLNILASTSGSTSFDGLQIDFTQSDDSDSADTNAALNINITSSSSDADTLLGINIANITASANTNEYGLQFGTGWDRAIKFADDAKIGFGNGTTAFIEFDDQTIDEISFINANVGIGSTATLNAALSIIGTSDQEQLLIRAASGQTNSNPLILFQDSAGGELFRIHTFEAGSLFIGQNAGTNASAGSNSIGIGQNSLAAITGANQFNVALGDNTLQSAQSGNNTAIGTFALTGATTGDGQNTGVGAYALYLNSDGEHNTAVGVTAGYNNLTGDNNAIFGFNAGAGSDGFSFSNNSIFGSNAGIGLSTGSNNIMIGFQAGDNITTGSNNVIIGYDQNAPSATADNQLNIGGAIYGNLAAGLIGIGTTSPTDKLNILATSSGSAAFDGLQIDFTQSDDSDSADTNAGLNINITSSSTDADTLLGINIASLSGSSISATERALQIGSGWDSNLYFNDTTTNIGIAASGTFTFNDGTNTLFTIVDAGTTGNVTTTGTFAVNGTTTLGDATSDTVTLTAKVTGATGAGLGFSDASFTSCSALETVAGMLSCGTDDVGGGAGVWTDGTATAYLAVSSDWVGIGTSTPTDKLHIVASASGSTSFDGLQIDFTQSDDTDSADTNAALNINITSSSSDADTVLGINIANITASANSVERALQIGSGWDSNLYFNDTTANIGIANSGTFTFNDGTNTLFSIVDTGTTGNVTVTGTLTSGAIDAVGESHFYQGSYNDPSVGMVGAVKISSVGFLANHSAALSLGIDGAAAGAGFDTYAGYLSNTSTVTGGGLNYGIYAIGVNNYFSGMVGIGASVPTDKLNILGSTSGSTSFDGLQIDFTQSDDSDSADTNAGLNINITSSSSDADTLLGINIANITGSASAVDRALQIGSGWDSNLYFNDTTSFIDVASGGTITFTGNTTLGDATTDTVTLTAKVTGASGAAIGFSNAAFTTCTALSTVAGMLTCDVDDVGGGGGAWTDGTNVVYLAVSADLVGIGTPTPVDKLQIDTSTSGSATFDGLAINFIQDDDADATDINSGLNIAITSSSSDADVVNGISITISGTSVSARERGISIGTGFDDDIYFASSEAKLRIQSGGQIDITDNFNGGNGSTGLPLGRFKEYFADANYGVWEAGGFVNIDGSFYQDQFTTVQLTQTQAPTAKSNMFGDDQRWGNIRGTACTVGQNNSTVSNFTGVGGFVELRLTTNSSACYFYMGYPMGAVTATTIAATSVPGILNAANKFVMYYKVKHDGATSTNRMIMIGADNYTAVNRGPVQAAIGASNTRGGIWFTNYTVTGTATNQASIGQWVGMAKKKTEVTHQATVTCGANSTIITNQYALMRIEARQTNDVQFFLDNNISNGINLEQCSTGITNTNAIPAFNLKPAVMVNNQSTAAQFSLFIDLFAFVQDDPRPAPGQEAPIVDNSPAPPPPPPDIIAGADLAEYYYFQDKTSVESGDVVVLGSYAGQAKKSENKYDRKLLGVVAEWPGLTLGEAHPDGHPIALSGRVPVKVNGLGGAIKIGDSITSSDVAGIAMKASEPGKIIGTAMENYDPATDGLMKKIMVNVHIGYYIGEEFGSTNSDEMVFGDSEIATESGSIAQNGAVVAVRSYIYKGLTVFWNKVTFKEAAEFWADVVFKSTVRFEGEVQFNNSSAGYAEIKSGERFVDVLFDKEYENEPVVNLSIIIPKVTQEKFEKLIMTGECKAESGISACQDYVATQVLDDSMKAGITAKTNQGFMILLNKTAPVDVTFSWQAVAVKNAKTTVSKTTAELLKELSNSKVAGVATSSATPTPTPKTTSSTVTISPNELGYLRLRAQPTTESEDLTHIPVGEVLSYSENSNGWYKVVYDDKTGWINEDYVTLDQVTPTPTVTSTPTPSKTPTPTPAGQSPLGGATPTVTSDSTVTVLPNDLGFVRMRSQSNTEGEDLAHIPIGTALSFTVTEYGWYKVSYEGVEGWVSGSYVAVGSTH